MAATDSQLVVRARAGDRDAFGVLLLRHRERLLRVCAAILGDPDLGADAAQEATLVAWLQLSRLRREDGFGSWLVGIGRICALRAHRERAGRWERVTFDGLLPDQVSDPRDEPVEQLLAHERVVEIAEAIRCLPDGQRDAVVLYHLADLPQQTVAHSLGTAVGAIRTRLHKARERLRRQLALDPDNDKESLMADTAIPARIVDVRRTPAGRHVVLLATDKQEVPIWIGEPEAEALAVGLNDVELPRPSTHMLALSLLRAGRRELKSVRISRLEEATFYAQLILDDGSVIDARPSDALILAEEVAAPITIDPSVLEAAALQTPDDYTTDLAHAHQNGSAEIAARRRELIAAEAAELQRIRAPR